MNDRTRGASGTRETRHDGFEEAAATVETIRTPNDLDEAAHNEMSAVGHWSLHLASGVISISAVFAERSLGLIAIDGHTYRTRLDETLTHYIHPEDRARLSAFTERMASSPDPHSPDMALSCRVIRPDGKLRYLTLLIKGGYPQDGRIEGVVQDITAQKRAEEAVRESEAFFRAVLESTASHLTVIDLRHQVRYFNQTAGAYLGRLFGRPYRIGVSIYEFVRPEYREQVGTVIEAALRGETREYETTICQDDGRERTFNVRYAPIRDQDDRIIAAVLGYQDITEQKANERQIAHMAYHDPLTGLPNRRLFYDRLHEAIERSRLEGERLAVVLFDLDHFKLVNDSLGHQQGDRLLQLAAVRIQGCLRERVLLARIGGDEFILMLPGLCRDDETCRVVQCMLDSLKEPFVIDGHEIRTSMSVGISHFPEHGQDAETLIRHADMAMYGAKDKGRNAFSTFALDMNEKLQNRVNLEAQLQKAINGNEFSLRYQPKVDLETGRYYGIEALIRWKSPEGSMIPPSEFIPVAEECGLIVPIGEWVLRTACEENKRLQEEGFEPLVVSVNLSARQFGQPDLAERIEAILRETGLEPRWLELEITETILMASPPDAAASLRRLKELGVILSVDDFGTGFSSLNYLKYFPIDVLKVDSSFVRDVPHGTKDIAITKSIISLAHNLKLQAIAEGVETAEQLSFLQHHGCDAIQGYYIATPLQSEELRERLMTPPFFEGR